jgi:PBS lyase HEAT-like repeat-containing protein
MAAADTSKPDILAPDRLPAQSLPPVEAPTATFLLQLFLIPLLIVSIVVVLWLLFGWLAHMGDDNPHDLVKSLARGDESSWHRAHALADLLRSPDPRYDAVRRDSKLALELAGFLDKDLNTPAQGKADAFRVKRRMFLCRAIGSFDVTDGLLVLMRAAKEEHDSIEIEVRLAALEGISTLAHNCGPESFRRNADLMRLLLEASREPDDTGPALSQTADGQPTTYRPHAEIRAVAAYALGVIGGDEALGRLKLMLASAYPNARYNAATGLARHGDPACIGVLKEMLDPDNSQSASDENNDRDKDRKRATVLMNGVRAALIFAEANPRADLTALKTALNSLAHAPLTQVKTNRSNIQSAAIEAVRLIEKPTR